jgi:hypothetical protein
MGVSASRSGQRVQSSAQWRAERESLILPLARLTGTRDVHAAQIDAPERRAVRAEFRPEAVLKRPMVLKKAAKPDEMDRS